ncbi:MAG: HupE/UreJ family protein [Gemmatimonadetes bacterium]|nr:HupE/UreJ family protein [Gemmatimonadota bacterium]MDA1101976.1 HupE/UreJ family protein [Gemmatimonadota bacterium]
MATLPHPVNRRTAALVVALILLLPSWPEAHEIPTDVTIQMFVKPDAGTLRMLVRVPLGALRDYDFPQRGPGYLEISEADELIRDAAVQWIGDYVSLYQGSEDLGVLTLSAMRVSQPGDRSFVDFDRAMAGVTSPPLRPETELFWQQAAIDLLFEVPITDAQADFSIDARMAHLGLRTLTVLRFLPAGGAERIFQYVGNPGLVRLDPRWHQAMWRFVVFGFEHILDGIDHILFLLCLVAPIGTFLALVPIVTAFTIAHSITLIASALGLAPDVLWFPALIETLIALSIVFMAFENIVGSKLTHRWMVAFAFGLVHGFGFSFALSESLQFAGGHLLTSLLSFNVGVEFGQLFVLAIAVPLLRFLFRRGLPEVAVVVLLSAVLAHTGWHWMVDRGKTLFQYDFTAPAMNAALGATALRWAMLALIILGTLLVLRGAFVRLAARTTGAEAGVDPM